MVFGHRAEEVFLPKGDQAGVMLKLPSAKNANAPWFHGSSWKEQLPALKAVALSCMIGTSLHLNTRRAQQSEAPSFNLKQCLATVRYYACINEYRVDLYIAAGCLLAHSCAGSPASAAAMGWSGRSEYESLGSK